MAHGGETATPDINTVDGAAGTIYIEDDVTTFPHTTLIVDGQRQTNLPILARTVVQLLHPAEELFFDELYLKGKIFSLSNNVSGDLITK